ncbi:MAG TPA: ABC transporter permease [Candidatus Hydrogenedentes bacterium]|nr:ABC transporter permease [Candidatus Hydrogenedentota bacterium]HRK33184.1 ABC transporter permease [Candidatus Hydrogenedentota bacterium]
MIDRIATAYLVELLKALRWKFTFIGPVFVIILVALAPLLHPVGGEDQNSYRFIAFATSSSLNLLGIFLSLSYCAGLVSTEASSGTIRLVLTRPLFRHEFIIAKLLTGATYAFVLTLAAAVTSWSMALTLGNLSAVEYGGEVVHTSGSMIRAYALGYLVAFAPQFAFVSFAVMISTLVRNTGAAVITAIGIWIVSDAVKYPLRIDKYLFGSYVDMPWSVFRAQAEGSLAEWTPDLYWCMGTSAGAALVFCAVAIFSLHRRNLHG